MKFRSDISFLRALSVIAVLLYHFKFSLFKGGFIGVDIFFVISGYLMSKIVLDGFSSDKFNLIEFYSKRVVRIFPALLVMITFFAVAIFLLIPTLFASYLRSYFPSTLFFSNIYYYLHSGYFDGSSQFNFLLHTWSLSVEWQFYMVYPLILLIFRRMYLTNKRFFLAAFIMLLSISFISMIIHSLIDQSYSFYIFYTRAWEMMFGGLAFLFEDKVKSLSKFKKNIAVLISILTICILITSINAHKIPWPSLLTVVPVIATTLIILFKSDLNFFNYKAVNFIGNISYSLYLWHWPFYVLSIFFNMNLRLRHRIIFILLSIIFAILSYYFVEKRNYKKKTLYVLATSFILFIISYSFSQPDYNDTKTAEKQYNLKGEYFRYDQEIKDYNFKKLSPGKRYILLLGDSHAGMFYQTISEIAKEENYDLIQITADGTYPMINANTPFQGPKEYFNYFYKEYFPKIKNKIELVIINSHYNTYNKNQLERNINFTENYFSKFNTKTLYLGLTPEFPIEYPTYIYIKDKYNILPELDQKFKEIYKSTNFYIKKKLGSKYLDFSEYPVKKQSKEGVPYVYDFHHLTHFGTEEYKFLIKEKIVEIISN